MLLAIQIPLWGTFEFLAACVCVCAVADGNVYDFLHKATNVSGTYGFAVQIPCAVPLPQLCSALWTAPLALHIKNTEPELAHLL